MMIDNNNTNGAGIDNDQDADTIDEANASDGQDISSAGGGNTGANIYQFQKKKTYVLIFYLGK